MEGPELGKGHKQYLCPQCGHVVDTRYATRLISEQEVAERREKILKMKF